MTEVWSVPYVGTVVNGIVNGGSVKAGEPVLLGPDSNGHYQSTVIKSMQRKRYVQVTFLTLSFELPSERQSNCDDG